MMTIPSSRLSGRSIPEARPALFPEIIMALPPWLHIDEYRSGSSRIWRFTCSACGAVQDLPPAGDGCLPEDTIAELVTAHRGCGVTATETPGAARKA